MHVDLVYKDLIRRVLDQGVWHTSQRQGIKCLSVLNTFYTLPVSFDQFPLITTKKINWNPLVHELVWYLSGDSHIRDLQTKTKIWDLWADDKGHLESAYGRYWRNYPLPEGQWKPSELVGGEGKWITQWGESLVDDPKYVRYWRPEPGAPSMKVLDQLRWVIDLLKKDPSSRRALVFAWYPPNALASKLPPCHFGFELQVHGNQLHLTLLQRSGDLLIGIPWNIAAYSLLLLAISQELGIEPGTFSHYIGNLHIYEDQYGMEQEQLKREPYELPQVSIQSRECTSLEFEDFKLFNYQHHPFIKYPVTA